MIFKIKTRKTRTPSNRGRPGPRNYYKNGIKKNSVSDTTGSNSVRCQINISQNSMEIMGIADASNTNIYVNQ